MSRHGFANNCLVQFRISNQLHQSDQRCASASSLDQLSSAAASDQYELQCTLYANGHKSDQSHQSDDRLQQSRPRLTVNVKAGSRDESFGHTLEDKTGGQLSAGLTLIGFYQDHYDKANDNPISQYMTTFIATRAVKPATTER